MGKYKNIVITTQNLLTLEMPTNDVLFILMVYFYPAHMKYFTIQNILAACKHIPIFQRSELAWPSTELPGKVGALACSQECLSGVVPAFLIRLVSSGSCEPKSKLDCKSIIQVNGILA